VLRGAFLSGILALILGGSAAARMLDLAKPEDVIAAEIRLNCAPDPAKPRLSIMTGALYGQRAGEPNRHLFDVQAVNTRACRAASDPTRGPGYRSVTREIMIYRDPATGRILDTWTNPWTGETVEVIHMFNDPVNMREPRFARDVDGKPARWEGTIVNGQAISRRIMPFFRDSPLGGDYQDYVGNKYAVMEASVTVVPAADWLDTARPTPVPATSVWTRTSPWLPWMKMGGREGATVLNAVWVTGRGLADVPEPLRGFIGSKHPEFAQAPPLDDDRPSVSSWDGMKRDLDARRRRP
jgi:hypothetical protein